MQGKSPVQGWLVDRHKPDIFFKLTHFRLAGLRPVVPAGGVAAVV